MVHDCGSPAITVIHGGTPFSLISYAEPSDSEAQRAEKVWHKYVHINGGVYYYHPVKRIITENDVEDPRWRNAILAIHKKYMETYEYNGVFVSGHVDDDAEVVIRYVGADDDELPELSTTSASDDEDDEKSDDSVDFEVPAESFFVCHKTSSEVRCPEEGPGKCEPRHTDFY